MMAITGIGNNYSNVYQNTYTKQKQETAKKEEVKETTGTQKNTGTENTTDYINTLAKLAPSVDFRVGNTFSSAKIGKTLTISPAILEKMQNDPEQEKETKELIKGVESMTRLVDGINKASGWTTVFRHSYIDENGKYCHIALVRNDFMLNMSDKLREERRENSKKLVEKTKEKAAEKKAELQEALEEKKEANTEGKSPLNQAEQLINEKIAASKDGMILFDDNDMQTLLAAAKEKEAEQLAKKSVSKEEAGAVFDMKI